MRRLREGTEIWLVKEQCHARADYPWQPDQPGFCAGKLILRRLYPSHCNEGEFYLGPCEKWYVKADGTGFDGQQLIQPTEGHLPEDYAKIADDSAIALEEMRKKIIYLEQRHGVRIAKLEAQIKALYLAHGQEP